MYDPKLYLEELIKDLENGKYDEKLNTDKEFRVNFIEKITKIECCMPMGFLRSSIRNVIIQLELRFAILDLAEFLKEK